MRAQSVEFSWLLIGFIYYLLFFFFLENLHISIHRLLPPQRVIGNHKLDKFSVLPLKSPQTVGDSFFRLIISCSRKI